MHVVHRWGWGKGVTIVAIRASSGRGRGRGRQMAVGRSAIGISARLVRSTVPRSLMGPILPVRLYFAMSERRPAAYTMVVLASTVAERRLLRELGG